MNQTAKCTLHHSVKTCNFGILKAVQLEKLADVVETKPSTAEFPEFALGGVAARSGSAR